MRVCLGLLVIVLLLFVSQLVTATHCNCFLLLFLLLNLLSCHFTPILEGGLLSYKLVS